MEVVDIEVADWPFVIPAEKSQPVARPFAELDREHRPEIGEHLTVGAVSEPRLITVVASANPELIVEQGWTFR
jgi:hypothetical protein